MQIISEQLSSTSVSRLANKDFYWYFPIILYYIPSNMARYVRSYIEWGVVFCVTKFSVHGDILNYN